MPWAIGHLVQPRRLTLDVVDGPPHFTRVLPGDPLPTFLYWLLDIEHYGGSLTVVGEDGAERTITIARPPELRWPGD